MIPKNITKDSVIKAINKINMEGVPKERESTKYNIRYLDKLYPPKYTISIANTFVNGAELRAEDFSGGKETNSLLMKLGFDIVKHGGIDIKNDKNYKSELEPEEYVHIATVTIQSPQFWQPNNEKRMSLLENIVDQAGKHADVLILPAGFFIEKRKPDYLYNEIENSIREYLNREGLNTTVCLGVDGRNGKDQIGLAVNRQGIVSMGRKFYPTEGEKGNIRLADNYLSTENGYSRIVQVKGKRLYIAICYDAYGIRKNKLMKPNVDGIINLVHRFNPQGDGESNEVYCAKYGFAGSSKQWNCPTFGAATFFARDIPEKWPTGVLWNQGDKSVQLWKYSDNVIEPIKQIEVSSGKEKAKIRIYLF